jgi:O-antigen/teichoic acid export membrane protein
MKKSISNKSRINPEVHDTSLIKAGIIFFVFSIIISVFNYLYHLVMGRMLGLEEYGVLGSLFAIIYIVTFSTSTFNLVISKNVAEFNLKDKRKIKYLFYKSFNLIAIIGLVLLSVFIALTPFIADFMNLSGITSLIIVGVIAYFSLFQYY